MQDESQIQWDPMYEYRPPWESRLLVLYLFVVLVVAIARYLPLLRQLGWFSFRRWRRRAEANSAIERADLLAASALANQPFEFPSVSADDFRLAHASFSYRWRMCSATVGSMKRLVVLTYLFSIALPAMQAVGTLRRILESRSMGTAALAAGTGEVLAPFALGVFVCALLYAACSWFEGALARRQISWDYFCARAGK